MTSVVPSVPYLHHAVVSMKVFHLHPQLPATGADLYALAADNAQGNVASAAEAAAHAYSARGRPSGAD